MNVRDGVLRWNTNKCWCWWRPFLCQLGNQIHTFIANIVKIWWSVFCVCFRNFHSSKLFESNNYTMAEIKITLLMVVFIAFCLLSVVHSISLGGGRFLFAACFMSLLSFHSAHFFVLLFVSEKKQTILIFLSLLCCGTLGSFLLNWNCTPELFFSCHHGSYAQYSCFAMPRSISTTGWGEKRSEAVPWPRFVHFSCGIRKRPTLRMWLIPFQQ